MLYTTLFHEEMYIIMKKIVAEKTTVLGGAAPYNLVSVEDAFDWSSGNRGERIGTYYTILRLTDMEKQRVFVREAAWAIDPEAVQQAANLLKFLQVDFDGFTGTVSTDRNGALRIYAEAESVKIISSLNGQRKES